MFSLVLRIHPPLVRGPAPLWGGLFSPLAHVSHVMSHQLTEYKQHKGRVRSLVSLYFVAESGRPFQDDGLNHPRNTDSSPKYMLRDEPLAWKWPGP